MKQKLNKHMITSFIVVTLYWFSLYVYIPYQTSFLSSLKAGEFMIGFITGAYGIAQVILRPPLGIMIDRQGKQKPFILIGVLGPGLASIIRLLTMSPTGFLFANILSGISPATWIVFLVYFARFFKEVNMQKSSSLMMAANQLGQLVGFILSLLLYPHFGMSTLLYLSVGAALIATALALSLKEENPAKSVEATKKIPVKDLLVVFRNKRLLFFSLLLIAQTGIVLATATSFNTKIIQNMGGDDVAVGLSMVIFMSCSVVTAFLTATKRVMALGAKKMMPFSFVIIIIFLILVPRATDITQIYLLQCLAGIYVSTLISFAIGEGTLEIPQAKRTTAMGLIQCFIAIGITVVPMITGKLVESYGLTTAYNVLAVFAFVYLVLSIWGTNTKALDAKPEELKRLNHISE